MIESLLCTTGLAIRHGTGGLTVLPTLCKELEHLHVLVSTRGLEPIPHGYLYFLSFLCLKKHLRDSPGGPVAKTSALPVWGPGFYPWSGN